MFIRKLCLVVTVMFIAALNVQAHKLVYSKEKPLNQWVEENLFEIQQLNRAQWLGLSDDMHVSRAVYEALTLGQKCAFWKEKFDETEQLPWSEAELKHIVTAENFLLSHFEIFNGELTKEQQAEIQSFMKQWKDYATQHFGWADKVVFAIVATPQKLKNTSGELIPLGVDIAADAEK